MRGVGVSSPPVVGWLRFPVREKCDVEMAELVWIGDDVDGHDPFAGEGEGEYHTWLPARRPDAAGRPVDKRWSYALGAAHELAGNGCSAPKLGHRSGPDGWTVEAQHNFWVQQLDESLEVRVAGGGEKRINDHALPGEVAVVCRLDRLDFSARPARDHHGRGRRTLEDLGDVIERHGEHVMEYEREPFGGLQRIKHHHECEADRVGEQCLLLRVILVCRHVDQLWCVLVEWLLAACGSRAKHVQADPANNGGQPAAKVLDSADVRAGKA